MPWKLSGTTTELAAGQTVTGFALGDTIDLEGFTEKNFSYVTNTGLELTNGKKHETINITGNFSTSFIVFDHDGTTEILLCYLRGTFLATPRGETAIDALQPGDHVLTSDGRSVPVAWAGNWSVDLKAVLYSDKLRPIRIKAGALLDGVPHRDLYVSPDHGIYLEGVLIPAWLLINGVSITQPERSDIVEYFHIQVEPHDILLAEGAAAESFLDLGTTGFTHPGEEPRNWDDACAPLCSPAQSWSAFKTGWRRDTCKPLPR